MATIDWPRILQMDSIQRMAELIRREFNLWVGFLTLDGQHTWIGTAQRTDKPLCDAFMIRNDRQTCMANYRQWIDEISPTSPTSLFMQCHAGMKGVVAPVVYQSKCVATFFASGFVFADDVNADDAIFERGDFLHINRSTLAHGRRELVRLTRRESQILRNLLEEMAYHAARDIERLDRDARRATDAIPWDASFSTFIGRSTIMRNIVDQARQASCSHSPILITGDVGTGKTRLAQAIREASDRRTEPYVVTDCEGIAAETLESELFGHKRGSSANAFIDKLGLLDVADKGALLIKNIDAMAQSTQTKIAQVIENGSFWPLGDVELHRVDVRIIATTTRNLHDLAKEKAFNRNLLEKISVIPIRLPFLAEHAEDISDLCRYFIDVKCQSCKRQPKTISQDALSILCQYSWPGNVRELENEIERVVVLSGTNPTIDANDIAPRIRHAVQNANFPAVDAPRDQTPASFGAPISPLIDDAPKTARDDDAPNGAPSETNADKESTSISPERLIAQYDSLANMLDAVEHEIIVSALALNDENRTQTAKQLKISRRHLVRKLENYRKRNS